jgi:hypothetical protein
MHCGDCGVELAVSQKYKMTFEITKDEDQVFKISFNKQLCPKCLTGSVYGLKGEVEFMLEESGQDKSELNLNINSELVQPI